MNTDHGRKLRAATKQLAAAEIRAATARTIRDATVREALAAGIPAATIAETTGLTRMRVYQIRDNTR